MSLFDLLVLDIDGVMTDGTKTYNENATVISKNFCDKDFTAIKRFKSAGINVCLLSGDTNVNEQMAKKRQIDFYYARNPKTGNIDKSEFIPTLCKNYNTSPDKIAYVGDDYYDLSIIENLKWTYCPIDAIQILKNNVHKVLNCRAGYGVVAELYDIYESEINYSFPYDSHEVNQK
jgi:3-deoxy-D-manno-octulosonate 8-phosphate phosphatase (KDO 8-P phosphatase)